jgi:hypothetical protein
MNRSGRISLVGLLGIIAVVALVFLLLFVREGLTAVGEKFMTALATGDTATLTKMSYMGDTPADQVQKEWQFATQVAGKHYLFYWRVLGATQASQDRGSIRLQVIRNAASPAAYEENYALPLVKVGDDWKVDVRGISREMYPGLPR